MSPSYSGRQKIVDLVTDGRFVRVWMAGNCGSTMRWLEILAIGIYVFDRTGSPLTVALVTLLRQVPTLLLGAYAGALAERINHKMLVLGGLGLCAVTALTLGLLSAQGPLPIWQVAVGTLISGVYSAVDLSVRRTMVGEIVGLQRLATAVAIDSGTNNVTRMIGPALGGAAYQLVGLTGAYFVAVAVYGIAVLLIASLAYVPGHAEARRQPILETIVDGFVYARRNPAILGTFAVTVVANFWGFPYSSMIPVIGRDELHLSAVAIGVLASMDGVGGVLGAVAIALVGPSRNFPQIFYVGTVVIVVAVTLFPLSPSYGMMLAVLFVGGLGGACFSAMQATIVLTAAPPELRTRVMGALTTCIGTGWIGILHLGLMANLTSASTAVLIVGIEGILAMAAIAYVWPLFRRWNQPS